jgi:hypothetical protein
MMPFFLLTRHLLVKCITNIWLQFFSHRIWRGGRGGNKSYKHERFGRINNAKCKGKAHQHCEGACTWKLKVVMWSMKGRHNNNSVKREGHINNNTMCEEHNKIMWSAKGGYNNCNTKGGHNNNDTKGFHNKGNVATLALGLRPRQGVARLQAKRETREHFTCSQECKECEGMNPPKWTPMLGIRVPKGLPNFQSTIARVKNPCLEEFFISLESYWSVDVKNGLALLIWTSETQVMAKRKAESQIGSLTPDH